MDAKKPINEVDYRIDTGQFLAVVDPILRLYEFQDYTQIILNYRPGIPTYMHWTHGAGSLWNDSAHRYWAQTSDFSELNAELKGTYVEEVIKDVRRLAAPKKIGRVRLLSLLPKTCYSLHKDAEEYRFHIPLVTNHSCFFISGNEIGRMETVGQLYTFNTRDEHTAVNADLRIIRRHLVFDTYE